MSKKEENIASSDAKVEFGIQRLFVKDLSFEAPNSPGIFLAEWKPEMQIDLHTAATTLESALHEVVLTLSVKVSLKEQVAFLIELQYAGIFSISGFPEDQMRPMLASFCPNILYPYAREVVSDAVARGGFPPLYLAPVNFDALYQQQLERERSGVISG